MNNNTMTINELYNDILFEVDVNINKAVTLMRVITGNYFEMSTEAFKKDKQEKFLFEASYEEIQSMIYILFDYVWTIKKEMETAMEANIIPDKATA